MNGSDLPSRYCLDIGVFQKNKRTQMVCGDTFIYKSIREENRTVAVLSDGLGSGVKANVLSSLTATMALNYTAGFRDLKKTAETIMRTLPECSVRKISYATFCIVDIDTRGETHIINYDSPEPMLIRDGAPLHLDQTVIEGSVDSRAYRLVSSKLKLTFGDRIVICSDGVSQAGIGTAAFAAGWGIGKAVRFASDAVRSTPDVSARNLSRTIVNRALDIDSGNALDDITCGIIHYRQPRELLIVSGPPVVTENDAEMAAIAHKFNGVKIICGGTTAKLIGRELKQSIVLDYKSLHCALPPRSSMKGFALVTEGIITLHEVARLLQSSLNPVDAPSSPAREIVELFLDCDVIRFLIGTRINEAWQDPTLPSDLGLRRTIVSQIARLLEEKFYKETRVQFL